MELKYAILFSESKHFPLKDPDKFYEMLKFICEKQGFDFKTALGYYYDKHVLAYEAYIKNKVPVDNELFKAGFRMTNYFEKWLSLEEE